MLYSRCSFAFSLAGGWSKFLWFRKSWLEWNVVSHYIKYFSLSLHLPEKKSIQKCLNSNSTEIFSSLLSSVLPPCLVECWTHSPNESAELQKLISRFSIVRTVSIGSTIRRSCQVNHSITPPSWFGFSNFLLCYWCPPFCPSLLLFFFFCLFLENVTSIYIFMIPGWT